MCGVCVFAVYIHPVAAASREASVCCCATLYRERIETGCWEGRQEASEGNQNVRRVAAKKPSELSSSSSRCESSSSSSRCESSSSSRRCERSSSRRCERSSSRDPFQVEAMQNEEGEGDAALLQQEGVEEGMEERQAAAAAVGEQQQEEEEAEQQQQQETHGETGSSSSSSRRQSSREEDEVESGRTHAEEAAAAYEEEEGKDTVYSEERREAFVQNEEEEEQQEQCPDAAAAAEGDSRVEEKVEEEEEDAAAAAAANGEKDRDSSNSSRAASRRRKIRDEQHAAAAAGGKIPRKEGFAAAPEHRGEAAAAGETRREDSRSSSREEEEVEESSSRSSSSGRREKKSSRNGAVNEEEEEEQQQEEAEDKEETQSRKKNSSSTTSRNSHRRQSSSSSSNSSSSKEENHADITPKNNPPVYAHIIFLHIGVAADERESEILELAWAVYDVEKRAVMDVAAEIIKPEIVHLSEEKLEEQGLPSPAALAHGGTLGDAIASLDKGVFRLCCESRKGVALCTYGRLKFCKELRYDAKRKGVTLFPHYNFYLDLRPLLCAAFAALRGDEAATVQSAAARLGVEVQQVLGSAAAAGQSEKAAAAAGSRGEEEEAAAAGDETEEEEETRERARGRETTAAAADTPAAAAAAMLAAAKKSAAVETCVLMAGLLQRMLDRGIEIKKEDTQLVEECLYNSDALHGKQQMFIVRLRGLPWDVSEESIVSFFKPVLPLDRSRVLVCLGFDKRTTGEAYVQLPTVELRDRAIRDLHMKLLGSRWIEVFRASDDEYLKADQRRKTILSTMFGGEEAAEISKKMNLTILKLRGLPWSCNEYEVVRFFKEGGFDIRVDDVVMGTTADGRLSGAAFVEMATAEEAEKARAALHRKYMGRRFIELYPATREEMLPSKRPFVSPAASSSFRYSACNIPLPHHYSSFHSRAAAAALPTRLPAAAAPRGGGGGAAAAGFFPPAAAAAAHSAYGRPSHINRPFSQHQQGGAYGGGHYGSSSSSNYGSSSSNYGGSSSNYGGSSSSNYGSSSSNYGGSSSSSSGIGGYGSYGGSSSSMPQQHQQQHSPSTGSSGGGHHQHSSSGGGSSSSSNYSSSSYGGGSSSSSYGGAAGAAAGSHSSSYYGNTGSSSSSSGGGGGGYSSSAAAAAAGAPSSNSDSSSSSSWNYQVLRLRGLPYSANEQHIVQFFNGFHMAAILPSTIPIEGRPSGEAYVQFVDNAEAWRAFQAKNGGRIDKRYIELFPSTKQEMEFAAQGGDPRTFRDRGRNSY